MQISSRCSGFSISGSAIALATLLLAIPGFAAEQATEAAVAANPKALVQRTAKNELAPSLSRHGVRYKLRKQDDKGTTTKEIVETNEGDVARLIARNGNPLTAEENKAELDRLNNLLAHPEIQEHRYKKEQEDSNRSDEMVRLLPDAFNYKFLGMTTGPNGPAYRLSFEPNPNFSPPDREAQVYHGMVGELWIDQAQERIVNLDAHLIADVEFGWGILGRLYKGGSLTIKQADVGDQRWETTYMKLNLTGVALMLKPLKFQTTEEASDFQMVPKRMSYQDAIHLLENTSNGPQMAETGADNKK